MSPVIRALTVAVCLMPVGLCAAETTPPVAANDPLVLRVGRVEIRASVFNEHYRRAFQAGPDDEPGFTVAERQWFVDWLRRVVVVNCAIGLGWAERDDLQHTYRVLRRALLLQAGRPRPEPDEPTSRQEAGSREEAQREALLQTARLEVAEPAVADLIQAVVAHSLIGENIDPDWLDDPETLLLRFVQDGNRRRLSLGEFVERYNHSIMRRHLISPEVVQAEISRVVSEELILDSVAAAGREREPAWAARWEWIRFDVLYNASLHHFYRDHLAPSEAAMEAYWGNHPERFELNAVVRVEKLVCADWAEAVAVYQGMHPNRGSVPFATRRAWLEHSGAGGAVLRSEEREIDLRVIDAGAGVPRDVGRALREKSAGWVSPPRESDGGICLFGLRSVVSRAVYPVAEVREKIAAFLESERREETGAAAFAACWRREPVVIELLGPLQEQPELVGLLARFPD